MIDRSSDRAIETCSACREWVNERLKKWSIDQVIEWSSDRAIKWASLPGSQLLSDVQTFFTTTTLLSLIKSWMNHQMSCLRKCLWAFFTRIWFLPECVLWCIFRRPVENISWGLQCLYGFKSIVPHWKLVQISMPIFVIFWELVGKSFSTSGNWFFSYPKMEKWKNGKMEV